MNAFDAALRAIFRNPHLSVPATYTPADRLPVELRVVFNQPEAAVRGGFAGSPTVSGQNRCDMLVEDVPEKPGRGCGLIVAGQFYTFGDVTRERGGRIWRAALANG